jgi:Family of unknown function (DUF5681)
MWVVRAMSKSGHRNPPKHSRFKKGVSGNPKGRPRRRKGQLVSHIISEVQNTPTAYRESGRMKLASRLELALKKLVNGALEGDAKSADHLFMMRTRAEKSNGAKIEKIIVEDWTPDFPGQTGEQKTGAHARENETHPVGLWEQADSSATDPPGSVSSIASPKLPGMNEPSESSPHDRIITPKSRED